MEIMSEVINAGSFPKDFGSYVDPEAGIHRVAGNQAIYIRLMGSFLKDITVERLLDQIELGDIENAEKTVHGIKGVAGNLSLTELYECAVQLEMRLKQGIVEENKVHEFLHVYERTQEYVRLLLRTFEG